MSTAELCATDTEKEQVRAYYGEGKSGKPFAVPARTLDLVESKVASAMPYSKSIGVEGTPQKFRDIWASIEAWGAQTKVGMLLSSNKVHTFNFPSLVPISLPDDGSGIQDIYADNGDGVHSHVKRSDIALVYAAKLPAGDKGYLTRTITFYDPRGELIFGVLAGEATGKGDPAAIAGFEKTWELIEGMPRACSK